MSSESFTDGAAFSGESEAPLPDVARKRLEWRCRRGMKELDLLLVRYVRGGYATAASAERAAFEEFLELPDPDIARYLIAGHVPEDTSQAAVCRAILQAH